MFWLSGNLIAYLPLCAWLILGRPGHLSHYEVIWVISEITLVKMSFELYFVKLSQKLFFSDIYIFISF